MIRGFQMIDNGFSKRLRIWTLHKALSLWGRMLKQDSNRWRGNLYQITWVGPSSRKNIFDHRRRIGKMGQENFRNSMNVSIGKTSWCSRHRGQTSWGSPTIISDWDLDLVRCRDTSDSAPVGIGGFAMHTNGLQLLGPQELDYNVRLQRRNEIAELAD